MSENVAHQVVDGVLAADAVVRAEAEGQEVAPVHDVLLARLAEAVRVEALRIREALQRWIANTLWRSVSLGCASSAYISIADCPPHGRRPKGSPGEYN